MEWEMDNGNMDYVNAEGKISKSFRDFEQCEIPYTVYGMQQTVYSDT